jgi:hypothetical protein
MVLAAAYGRYGYRWITKLLNEAGWHDGTDRVQPIWCREGLKVHKKQRPRGRIWFNDGSSCIRLGPEPITHVSRNCNCVCDQTRIAKSRLFAYYLVNTLRKCDHLARQTNKVDIE